MALHWDKLKRVQEVEDWKNQSFDGGPRGGYMPNLSQEDQEKWRAKIVGVRTGFPQVEIRKTVQGAQMLIIVNLGEGYSYKHNKPQTTRGINVHLSLNGGAQLTFDEMAEMHEGIEEARTVLAELVKELEQKAKNKVEKNAGKEKDVGVEIPDDALTENELKL